MIDSQQVTIFDYDDQGDYDPVPTIGLMQLGASGSWALHCVRCSQGRSFPGLVALSYRSAAAAADAAMRHARRVHAAQLVQLYAPRRPDDQPVTVDAGTFGGDAA